MYLSKLAKIIAPIVTAVSLAITPAAKAQDAQSVERKTQDAEPGSRWINLEELGGKVYDKKMEDAKSVVFSGLYSRFSSGSISFAGSFGKDHGYKFWNSGIRGSLRGYPIDGNLFGELLGGIDYGTFVLHEQGEYRQISGGILGMIGYDFARSLAIPVEERTFNDVVFIPRIGIGFERVKKLDDAFIEEEEVIYGQTGILSMNGPFQLTANYMRLIAGKTEAHLNLQGGLEGNIGELSASYDFYTTGTLLVAQAQVFHIKHDLEGVVNKVPVQLTSKSTGYSGLFGILQRTEGIIPETFIGAATRWKDNRIDHESSIAKIGNDQITALLWSGIIGGAPSRIHPLLPDIMAAVATFDGRSNSYEVSCMVGYSLR